MYLYMYVILKYFVVDVLKSCKLFVIIVYDYITTLCYIVYKLCLCIHVSNIDIGGHKAWLPKLCCTYTGAVPGYIMQGTRVYYAYADIIYIYVYVLHMLGLLSCNCR